MRSRIHFAVQTPDGVYSRADWVVDGGGLPIKGQIVVFDSHIGPRSSEVSFRVEDVVRYWDHAQIYIYLTPLPPSIAVPDQLRLCKFTPDAGEGN